MKTLTTLITILFISVLSSTSWSETLTMDDLVEREGLHYKKFTNVPFTGEVSGRENGKFKNGIKDGEWLSYHKNGQLLYKVNYKDGKKDGPYEDYYDNGQLKSKGNFKDTFDGLWVRYHKNGQLQRKGNYKDWKKEGLWEWYFENGSLVKTETWKNGVKQ